MAGKTAPDCVPSIWRPSTFWCNEIRDQASIIVSILFSMLTSLYGGIAFYSRFKLGRQRLSQLGVKLEHLNKMVKIFATAFLIDKVIRLHKLNDEITIATLWRALPFDEDMDKDVPTDSDIEKLIETRIEKIFADLELKVDQDQPLDLKSLAAAIRGSLTRLKSPTVQAAVAQAPGGSIDNDTGGSDVTNQSVSATISRAASSPASSERPSSPVAELNEVVVHPQLASLRSPSQGRYEAPSSLHAGPSSGAPYTAATSSNISVVSSGRSNAAEDIGHEQLQQHRRIADSIHEEQRHAAAAAGGGTRLETGHGSSVVHKRTFAPLALNPRGKGGVTPLIAAIMQKKQAGTRQNEGYEMEHLPGSRGAELPSASASPQPYLRTSAHAAISQLKVHATTAQILIPQPPSRSRSRPRDTVTSATDAPAGAVVVPQPPPRSRSSSRPRVLADTAGAHAPADSNAATEAILHQPTQVQRALVDVPSHGAAALQPMSAAKQASGGSVSASTSSSKRSSKKPAKSANDLWNESMQRAREQGIQFEEV